MKKNLTTSFLGITCFFLGVFTQYILPVNSIERIIECREIPTLFPETTPSENSEIKSEEEQIRQYARKITVKVLSGQNSGSGILIHQQENTYQVLTNDHVLLFGKQDQSYRIQTPDGKIYPAKVVNNLNFQAYDLGVLQFESNQVYEVVSLSSSSSFNLGETVYAAGFPYEMNSTVNGGFSVTTGTVDLISELSFRGGYKIGYTNDVKKGMSGGPLLNEKGEVIGINGRHKYPVWGNPYIFEDGTVASPEKKEQMSQYSWAIPIQTFLHFAPRFSWKK